MAACFYACQLLLSAAATWCVTVAHNPRGYSIVSQSSAGKERTAGLFASGLHRSHILGSQHRGLVVRAACCSPSRPEGLLHGLPSMLQVLHAGLFQHTRKCDNRAHTRAKRRTGTVPAHVRDPWTMLSVVRPCTM